MNPDTVLAMARISELNRQRSDPMTGFRHEANSLRRQARRDRRISLAGRVGAAFRTAVSGHRMRKVEPAT